MSNYLRLKKMLYVVSLAAVSIVLALIEIPWFPPFSFLKLDFSEVAILVALLVLGNKETFLVILVRAIARRLFLSVEPAELVGEALATIASLSIMFAYNVAKKLLKDDSKPLIYEVSVNGTKNHVKETVVYIGLVAVSLAVFLTIINFFFTTPLYLSLPPLALSESGNVHFWAFSFINDSFYTVKSYTIFILTAYIPFNLVKGSIITFIFMVLKPRMKYLEL